MPTVLSDRYRLDELLASGGMGAVWRATDQRLDRTVAVKVLAPAFAGDAEFVARFQAEARTMAALRHHPNIVSVYDHGEDGGDVYLVMEFVPGMPLSKVLEERGRLPAAETLRIVAQAATALQVVHDAGVVHRDVKPSNLLIEDDGRGTVRLADFGVARSPASVGLTGTQHILGTAQYMAPEQAMGRGATAAADIYALGALAYHCLAGEPPFSGETPVEVALHHVQDEPAPLPDDVPEQARAIVARAMQKDPLQRFESAASMAAACAVGAPEDDALATVAAAAPFAIGRQAAPVPLTAGSRTLQMLPVAPDAAPARRARGRVVAGVGAGAVALAAIAALVLTNLPQQPVQAPIVPSGSPAAPTQAPSAPQTNRPTGDSNTRTPSVRPTNNSPTPSRTNSPTPAPAVTTSSPPEPTPTTTPTPQSTTLPMPE